MVQNLIYLRIKIEKFTLNGRQEDENLNQRL